MSATRHSPNISIGRMDRRHETMMVATCWAAAGTRWRAFADRAVQMLAIARVLVGEPRLLLVDEPSEGLAPMMVTEIYAILKELKQAGRAILLVEQNVPQTLTLSDRFVAMERGRLVLAGDARAAADCERLMAAITV